MFDHDDWAKETCNCGHARYRHLTDGETGCFTELDNGDLCPCEAFTTEPEWVAL